MVDYSGTDTSMYQASVSLMVQRVQYNC